ncbi:aconitase X catalytic domain-containing protein [Caldisphaera sp.]|uniref:aconitase X catalytic domain-containing protein n=1 Tax=Caldisphaera sp. TaxID=2060322 RepID=UPI003D0B9F32
MYLTKEEEKILNGEYGWGLAKAMQVIVSVGDSLNSEKLIGITHAHISGVSYGNIGEPGKKLIKQFSDEGIKFSVKTTVNPIGYDTLDYDAIPFTKIDRNYIKGQEEVLRSLQKMGADLTLSCTPYYLPMVNEIKIGSSVAWGESNAVVYGNSVLGIKTNREGGPISLMAAIVGKIYYYGLHIEENRIPEIKYKVNKPENYEINEVRASIIGEIISKIHNNDKPPYLYEKLRNETTVKEFSASIGAAGNLAMVVIKGITPIKFNEKEINETITIDFNDIKKREDELKPNDKPDLIYFGCPHTSKYEIEKIAKYLKKVDNLKTQIVITSSRNEMSKIDKDVLNILKSKNVKLIGDTCLIVSPFGYHGLNVVTNSYKAYFYLSKKGINVSLISLDDLEEVLRL